MTPNGSFPTLEHLRNAGDFGCHLHLLKSESASLGRAENLLGIEQSDFMWQSFAKFADSSAACNFTLAWLSRFKQLRALPPRASHIAGIVRQLTGELSSALIVRVWPAAARGGSKSGDRPSSTPNCPPRPSGLERSNQTFCFANASRASLISGLADLSA